MRCATNKPSKGSGGPNLTREPPLIATVHRESPKRFSKFKTSNLQKRGYLSQVFLGYIRRMCRAQSEGSLNYPGFRFVLPGSFLLV